MLLIIKNIINKDFDFEKYKNFSNILLINDGIYNLANANLNCLLKFNKINILKDDLNSRDIEIPEENNEKFNLINYNDFVKLTIENYPIFYI